MKSGPSSNALDERLRQVLAFIRWPTHADIGSDHAHLPLALLETGRCEQVIAVELNEGPYQHSLQAARRATPERLQVRKGDGFAPLRPNEVDGVSICGMGAQTIIRVLEQAAWLPKYLVLQPNSDAGRVRRWAYTHGYHLQDEALAAGFWRYPVLALQQAQGPDRAYSTFTANWPTGTATDQSLDKPTAPEIALEIALDYGPHLLRRRDPLLAQELQSQLERLQGIASGIEASLNTARNTPPHIQQERVQAALNYWNSTLL